MKNLFLTTITALGLLVCITSCEADNDLQELEQNISKSGVATIRPVQAAGKSATLESFWMRKDHEPRHRGNAEIYAHIIGLDRNKRPVISTVRMPYANHDKTVYYPNQKLIDWENHNYAGGLVSIVFIEADDVFPGLTPPEINTSYPPNRFRNTPVPQAVNIITDDFLRYGSFNMNGRRIYGGEDDIVDIFRDISRYKDYVITNGAVGGLKDNVYLNLRRNFD